MLIYNNTGQGYNFTPLRTPAPLRAERGVSCVTVPDGQCVSKPCGEDATECGYTVEW